MHPFAANAEVTTARTEHIALLAHIDHLNSGYFQHEIYPYKLSLQVRIEFRARWVQHIVQTIPNMLKEANSVAPRRCETWSPQASMHVSLTGHRLLQSLK